VDIESRGTPFLWFLIQQCVASHEKYEELKLRLSNTAIGDIWAKIEEGVQRQRRIEEKSEVIEAEREVHRRWEAHQHCERWLRRGEEEAARARLKSMAVELEEIWAQLKREDRSLTLSEREIA
jgi:hypothetical protein